MAVSTEVKKFIFISFPCFKTCLKLSVSVLFYVAQVTTNPSLPCLSKVMKISKAGRRARSGPHLRPYHLVYISHSRTHFQHPFVNEADKYGKQYSTRRERSANSATKQ